MNDKPESVVQAWLSKLSWKQQSILFSSLRGPDVGNVPNLKKVNRWMRTVSQHNADPTKNYMRQAALPDPLLVCEELEFLSCHYVHHFADGLAVIAYGHPDLGVARQAAILHFRIAEELFHFIPEQRSTFKLRHRDKPDGEDLYREEWTQHEQQMFTRYFDEALDRFTKDVNDEDTKDRGRVKSATGNGD